MRFTSWQLRKARIYRKLAGLEQVVLDGGRPDLSGWDLREQLLQTLEKLPQLEAEVWQVEHREVRDFIKSQTPPPP